MCIYNGKTQVVGQTRHYKTRCGKTYLIYHQTQIKMLQNEIVDNAPNVWKIEVPQTNISGIIDINVTMQQVCLPYKE